MDFFIFFTIFSYVFLVTKAYEPNNMSSIIGGPLFPGIRYPFRIEDEQPRSYGCPGFELFFRQNKTYIRFPTYGDLIVKSISYDTRKLNLIDPKNCVPEVFLNLNLSLSPFNYYYVPKQYTYINCSSQLSNSFVQVPCLSGSNHHVYVVESLFSPPVSCDSVKTVAIPFSYSPYLSDNSFGLSLTWNLTGECDDAGTRCQSETLPNKEFLDFAHDKDKSHNYSVGFAMVTEGLTAFMFVQQNPYSVLTSPRCTNLFLGFVAFIFWVVTLFYAKIALYKAFDFVKEKEKFGEIKVGEELGEYGKLPTTVYD